MVDINLIDFVRTYSIRYDEERTKLQRCNVIEQLHANENAHSRILVDILNYNIDGQYLFVESFKHMLAEKCSDFENLSNLFVKPEITIEKRLNFGRRIDIYIENYSHYAVIIENKVNWAPDQQNQIDYYFKEISETTNLEDQEIFIVYLTRDGSKVVSENSFNEVKERVGYKGKKDTGRFLSINFKEDIIPWLQDTYNSIPKGSDYMEIMSAIYQYVEYLKIICGLKKDEKEMNEKILKELLGDQYDNQEVIENLIDKVQHLSTGLTIRLEEYKTQVYIDKVINPIKVELGDKYKIEENVKANEFWFYYTLHEFDDFDLNFGVWYDENGCWIGLNFTVKDSCPLESGRNSNKYKSLRKYFKSINESKYIIVENDYYNGFDTRMEFDHVEMDLTTVGNSKFDKNLKTMTTIVKQNCIKLAAFVKENPFS